MNETIRIDTVEFLAALQQGDREAFAQFVEQTSPQVYRLALRITADPHDAEDVLQETYLKALSHLQRFEGRSSLMTWLYRIATNEALMALRRRKPELAVEEEADDDTPSLQSLSIVDWGDLPEDRVAQREMRGFLNTAIETLSPALKAVFILRDVQDFSGQETADILGITESAVKVRLMRARMKLREELTGYFQEQAGREANHD